MAVSPGEHPYRIGVLCPGCGGAGSVAHVAIKQAERLASAFDVSLASETLPPSLAPGLRAIPLRPRRFDGLRRLCHVPNALAIAAEARATLLAMRPAFHLLLLHDLAQAALVGRWLRRRAGIPYAICAHEDITSRPRGTYGLLHTTLHRWATPLAYREACAVLAISPHMAALARGRGVSPERVALVPPGIDLEELGALPRVRECGSERPLQLLYSGRLAVEKGIDVLLTALRLLVGRGTECSLSLAGAGPLLPRLQRHALRLGLGERVRFVGNVPREQLGHHYSSADVVCIPSLDEPFGLVALEALASGTPVVASEVGGLPYLVRHGVNGLLVPPAEPVALADALGRLDRDRGLLAALRRGSGPSVRRRFTWERSRSAAVAAVRTALNSAPQPVAMK